MDELNKFERSILEKLSSKYPEIKKHIPYLKVENRENTGVGMYINFCYTNEDIKPLNLPDLAISTNDKIELQGLQYGLGYEVDRLKGRLNFIELITYGEEWDGNVTDFTFIAPNQTLDYQDAFIVKLPTGIKSKNQLLQFLYLKFRLPEYFGFNWDALSECLRDFHWIDEKLIVLFHEALPSLKDQELKIYLEILTDACSAWQNDKDHQFKVVFKKSDRKKIKSLMDKE